MPRPTRLRSACNSTSCRSSSFFLEQTFNQPNRARRTNITGTQRYPRKAYYSVSRYLSMRRAVSGGAVHRRGKPTCAHSHEKHVSRPRKKRWMPRERRPPCRWRQDSRHATRAACTAILAKRQDVGGPKCAAAKEKENKDTPHSENRVIDRGPFHEHHCPKGAMGARLQAVSQRNHTDARTILAL